MERKKSRSAPGAVLDRLASQDWLMLEELRRPQTIRRWQLLVPFLGANIAPFLKKTVPAGHCSHASMWSRDAFNVTRANGLLEVFLRNGVQGRQMRSRDAKEDQMRSRDAKCCGLEDMDAGRDSSAAGGTHLLNLNT